MLKFLYAGSYLLPEKGSHGLDTLHHAGLYTMALKYQIADLCKAVRHRLRKQFLKCQGELHISCKAHDFNQPDTADQANIVNITPKEIEEDLISFEAFLRAVGVLLDGTLENDPIRVPLLAIDWSRLVPMGKYRAPWFEFVSGHPEYAADVVVFCHNEQYAEARTAELRAKRTAQIISTAIESDFSSDSESSDGGSALTESDESYVDGDD